MRLGVIAGLFGLSFALLFLCVDSQTPSCTSGWFGSGCKYKCRCVDDKCDVNGACTAPSKCQGGWFGPACQYSDIAYSQALQPELTDGDDSTCNPTTNITIPLNDTQYFTWMRVIVSDQAPPAGLDKLEVIFSLNSNPVNCDDRKTNVVDKRTVDLHCNLTEEINEVNLNALEVSGLCSVYVSGGRNVAIKEKAHFDKTYNQTIDGVVHTFGPSLAVDGNNNQDFLKLGCAHSKGAAILTLTLSMSRSVYRYVLYSIIGNQFNMVGFSLTSFDSSNRSVFEYKDPRSQGEIIYRLFHKPTSIETIALTVFNGADVVQLCEMEVYGDSECDNKHFGRDCELNCRCQIPEACFVSTGGCPSGCSAGFQGAGCMMECPAGKYGTNCNSSCSPNCMPAGVEGMSPCEPATGNCRKGCKDGFSGSLCLKECPAGKFGANCSSSCSPNCMPTGVEGMSACEPATGNCRKGCRAGFSGSSCIGASVDTTSAMDLLPIIVGVCLLFAAITFFGYCFCKKRSAPPSAERKAASVHPEQLK